MATLPETQTDLDMAQEALVAAIVLLRESPTDENQVAAMAAARVAGAARRAHIRAIRQAARRDVAT